MIQEGAREVQAKYICLDIVAYSNRPVETQIEILHALNDIVKKSVERTEVPQDEAYRMFIPTGDGMCIAFLNIVSRDIHLRVARDILNSIKEIYDKPVGDGTEFKVRVGIHAQTDHVIKDINLDNNLAGAGINFAFRVMDLADGGQILASRAVFDELKAHDLYKGAFRLQKATLKHKKEEEVYQFTGDEVVPRRMPKVISSQQRENQIADSIRRPARALGLKAVYRCRDRNVIEDVIRDITAARSKVLLSGVGLPDIILDRRVLQALSAKTNPMNSVGAGNDIRVLLLDAFRSPAIFRALIESNCEEAGGIVNTKRRICRDSDPYFSHRLYTNFEAAYRELTKLQSLAARVRFYGHAPSCWLAIIDHTVYFQPYTFGDASDDPQSHAIGRQMPVFKFQGQSRTPYRILEDHFNKLWLTSDIDLFHTGARTIAKAKVLWETFDRRKEGGPREEKESKWLAHVFKVLCNEENPMRDRRTYLRRPCISELVAYLKWQGEFARYAETKTDINNFSLEGTLLELKVDVNSELFTSLPGHRKRQTEEIFVDLRIEPEGGWPTSRRKGKRGIPDVEAARHLVNNFLKPTRGEFIYVRKDIVNGKPCVAFQARAHT